MKYYTGIVIIGAIILLASCSPDNSVKQSQVESDHSGALPEWFSEGKFGMFIHWGPYSVFAGEWKDQKIEQGDIAEWIMKRFEIPVEEYKKVAATFNPVKFNAEAWTRLAKDAGMKYMIITSKHTFLRATPDTDHHRHWCCQT